MIKPGMIHNRDVHIETLLLLWSTIEKIHNNGGVVTKAKIRLHSGKGVSFVDNACNLLFEKGIYARMIYAKDERAQEIIFGPNYDKFDAFCRVWRNLK